MERKRNKRRSSQQAQVHTWVSSKAKITKAAAESILKCYADQVSPAQVAERSGLSLNTVYQYYDHIRDRLTASTYYTDGALSFEEAGLGPDIITALKQRRGIRDDDIYVHSAELIHWAQNWPPKLVLKHIRKIIELSGPLDDPFELTGAQLDRLKTYVRYARSQLIVERARDLVESGEQSLEKLDRWEGMLKKEWNAYRAACKRVERERS